MLTNQSYLLTITTHHSPLTTHHSPLTTHHSPLTTHHSPLTTHPQATLRRRPHPRLHAGVRRSLRQLPAGAARRRRHQDRAARAGRTCAAAPSTRSGRRATWRPAWMAINSNKRNHRPRPHQAEIDRDRAPPRRQGRRGDGELPPRHHGPHGHRLRGAVGPEPAAHLLRGVGLRPERPRAHHRRLRRQDPGDERHHVGHRPSRRGADAGGLCHLRCHRRHDGGVRGVERALPAHAHGPRPARRRRHAGRVAGVPVLVRDRLHGWRPRAGPVGQPGAEPAADGRRVQGARAATSCSPSTTRSSSAPWRARSACRTSPRTRGFATGRRASPTMPPCAPSSRRCSPGRRQDLGGAPHQG